LKPRKKDKKNGKNERIESEWKYLRWNPRCEKKSEENQIKEKKSWKIPYGDDDE
jgi:hypothetical protein